VFGAGMVGLGAVAGCRLQGAERIVCVDLSQERLEMARRNGIEPISFSDQEDISDTLRELTDGRGPDSTIDAVGMEAHGAGAPLAELAQKATGMLPDAIAAKVTEKAAVDRLTALLSCIDSVRRGGTVSISGVYGGQLDPLPMMQIFDSEEMPPPMPSSCRPFGSGEPITCRKIGSQSAGSAGRSSFRNITALEVPPRMNTARSRAFAMEVLPSLISTARHRGG